MGLSPPNPRTSMSTLVTIRKSIEVADDIAEFIATPDPSRPFANAIGNAGRRVCDGWSAASPWTQLFLAQVTPGGLAGAALLSTVCKPYLDGEGYDLPELETLPGQTGQCPVRYDFTWTVNGNPESNQSNFQWIGPMTQPVKVPGFSAWFEFQNGNGNTFRAGSQFSTNNGAFTGWLRVDGQPDDCAPGGDVIVPGPNPAPAPLPWPPGEDPGVDPTGQPFFYVPDIETPFEDLPLPEDPFAPELQPGAGDGLPGDDAAIGDEAGEVTGGEDGEDIDFGEPPEGRVWVGCIVETTSNPAVGNIPGTGPASTVWPTVRGNLALNYGSLKGDNKRINSKFTEAFRPVTSLIVTGCFLQVQQASSAKVFPISALKCPQNPCEGNE